MIDVLMMGSSASIGAAQGIQAWLQVMDRSAASIAGDELIDAMVGLNQAKAGVKANIAVLRTADEMLGTLIDMKA
jgi:hypothetical protein